METRKNLIWKKRRNLEEVKERAPPFREARSAEIKCLLQSAAAENTRRNLNKKTSTKASTDIQG